MNDVLAGDRTVDEVVAPTMVPGLYVITRGSRAHMSLEVLSTDAMAALLDEVAERFDIVILDTPPSAGLTDAVTLSRMVDLVVIVARAGRVTRSLLRYTVRRFEQAGSAVRGVVLNDVDSDSLGGKYYYYRQQRYYYYQSSEGGEAAK